MNATATATEISPRHLEILRSVDSYGEVVASREVPYPTLAAMARRGLVEIRTRRQGMIGTDPRPYKLARITDAGRAAVADAEETLAGWDADPERDDDGNVTGDLVDRVAPAVEVPAPVRPRGAGWHGCRASGRGLARRAARRVRR